MHTSTHTHTHTHTRTHARAHTHTRTGTHTQIKTHVPSTAAFVGQTSKRNTLKITHRLGLIKYCIYILRVLLERYIYIRHNQFFAKLRRSIKVFGNARPLLCLGQERTNKPWNGQHQQLSVTPPVNHWAGATGQHGDSGGQPLRYDSPLTPRLIVRRTATQPWHWWALTATCPGSQRPPENVVPQVSSGHSYSTPQNDSRNKVMINDESMNLVLPFHSAGEQTMMQPV